MLTAREIVFIDPAVADIPALIAGLRPGVLPVLLGGETPASEEIARALRGRQGLDAIHIVVHGRSGELSFSAGALSLASIDRNADDLAAIGDALGSDGDLLLWSCRTGEGERGRAFVDALSRAAGAPVAAARGLVGAAALGGGWELETQSLRATVRPPLTPSGIGAYADVLFNNSVSAPAGLSFIVINYPATNTQDSGSPGSVVFLGTSPTNIVGSFVIPDGVAGSAVVPIFLTSGATVNVYSSANDNHGNYAVHRWCLPLHGL
jgi:collagen type VII alpha